MNNEYGIYNNRETWLVSLWINNDRYLYFTTKETVKDADNLKDFIFDYVRNISGTGFVADLAFNALFNVDFDIVWRVFNDE